MRLFIAAVLVVLFTGCGGDATEVLIVTDSDLPVPGGLDSLETTVTGPDGEDQRAVADLTDTPLPRRLSVLHDGGPLGPFEVVVSGRLMGTPLVSRRARFEFVPGESRVLVMHLVASCITTTCPGGQTCTETGCRPVDVPPTELTPWTGENPTLGGSSPDSGGPDSGTPDSCSPAPEQCNGADDDCDGMVDEDFDLMTDPDNCGTCGNGCRGRADMCCLGMCERRC
ncbi:MAG: hypothetical protein JRH11_05705 [Deltaproteobacteria bacterium]|nr:hypothetical protein [Deltaproteobacteria bacterium]